MRGLAVMQTISNFMTIKNIDKMIILLHKRAFRKFILILSTSNWSTHQVVMFESSLAKLLSLRTDHFQDDYNDSEGGTHVSDVGSHKLLVIF